MIVFDIESDGLLDDVSIIHCLSYYNIEDGSSGSLTDYNDIIDFVTNAKVLVGHNIVRYDIPVLEKILDIKVPSRLIDTLAISWYLDPERVKSHGLEAWGEELGVSKPKIEDWSSLDIKDYIHRCEEDVKINTLLFNQQYDYLKKIYEDDEMGLTNILGYLSFKMDCLKDQEAEGIVLDSELCERSKHNLDFMMYERIEKLAVYMPKVVKKSPPKVMYKQDFTISAHGQRWFDLLKSMDLPMDSEHIYEKGNPTSPKQLKEWLFILGWIPETFKMSKATGKNVEQISLPFGGGLCPSVKKLFKDHPFLIELDGLYMTRHRLGLINGFLESQKEGKVYSTAHGFTNTLRMQHSKPLVNLPGVNKFYGKEIRGCLTIPDDKHVMFGADISGLEDNTKQHYIYFFDPQYVTDMRVPGFDPHIDIAVLAEMVIKEEEEFFKYCNKAESLTPDEAKRFKEIKKIRSDAKQVNFSATYGAGPPKIAETLGCTLAFATTLHKTYWERNKAVKQTAKAVKTKTVGKQKWLFNPVSKFWYFLKADKDKFSTLNQSTGVFVFDTWLSNVRKALVKYRIPFQYHDELLGVCLIVDRLRIESLLHKAMETTNKTLNLNVDIGISVDWGNNYADCH